QLFGHFIRNFDPARDFLQRLSNLVIIRESDTRFLGILSNIIKIAMLIRVERFLHEILQRGLSDRPRAKPISNRRTLNMLMNNIRSIFGSSRPLPVVETWCGSPAAFTPDNGNSTAEAVVPDRCALMRVKASFKFIVA